MDNLKKRFKKVNNIALKRKFEDLCKSQDPYHYTKELCERAGLIAFYNGDNDLKKTRETAIYTCELLLEKNKNI